jgi:class 3 adenylate cyclase
MSPSLTAPATYWRKSRDFSNNEGDTAGIVHDPPRILIVDDNENNRVILTARLSTQGYSTAEACDGAEALEAVRREAPDLVLLDVSMPRMDGLEARRGLKSDESLGFVPVILVTARSDSKDVVAGLEAGADEYLTKPVDPPALVARVRSMLRVKELHDRATRQATELAAWNEALERRVAEQVIQIERANRLKRFLSPQVADLVLASPAMEPLESHRREVTVVFCDLRGFTAFAEIAEPEEVMAILPEYHAALGALIHEFQGTLERFVGDGVLVLFNDPIPCPDPCLRAARMAAAMRSRLSELAERWRASGHSLGFGVGIAHGYATLGTIGFEGRSDYSAIGTVVNLAARLCAEAGDGHILIEAKVRAAIEDAATLEPAGNLALKGLQRAVPAFYLHTIA